VPHHTKDKGDLGVLKAQADLCFQGYTILTPCTEHAPFDLVVYKDGFFKRVQVKYRRVRADGTIHLTLRSCWSDSKGCHVKPSDKKEVDIVCIYCPDTDKCYYVAASEVGQCITLRITHPKNNQRSGVKLAGDYTRTP
jgi:hypothetical protein